MRVLSVGLEVAEPDERPSIRQEPAPTGPPVPAVLSVAAPAATVPVAPAEPASPWVPRPCAGLIDAAALITPTLGRRPTPGPSVPRPEPDAAK